MNVIRFTLIYEVKQKRKFEAFLHRFQTDLGLEFQELKIERYWKMEDQFQAHFFIRTDEFEKEKRVYEALTMAQKLWSTGSANWSFMGPYKDGSEFFACILNNEKDDQALKWAHIQLEGDRS